MSRIKKHLTPSTAIAFLALIFAITGGAFAATGHGASGGGGAKATAAASATPLATTAKSKGARGPRGPKGATGATGKTGLTGAPGPQGPTGATGATGATGPGGSGESVTVKTLKPGGTPCPEGGAEFTNASGKAHACNGTEGGEGNPGKPGEPGILHPGESLPAGATETGTFVANFPKEGFTFVSISFPIRLAAVLPKSAVSYISSKRQEEGKQPAQCIVKNENGVEEKGTAENPVAAKGNLCIYEGGVENTEPTNFNVVSKFRPGSLFGEAAEGAGTSGAILGIYYAETAENVAFAGSWAVTEPEA